MLIRYSLIQRKSRQSWRRQGKRLAMTGALMGLSMRTRRRRVFRKGGATGGSPRLVFPRLADIGAIKKNCRWRIAFCVAFPPCPRIGQMYDCTGSAK
jgi:hypothetical protein